MLPPFFSLNEFSTFLSFLLSFCLPLPACHAGLMSIRYKLLRSSSKLSRDIRAPSYGVRAILCSLFEKQWQSFFLEIQASRWNQLIRIFWITSLFQGLTLTMAFTAFLQLYVLTLTYQENAVYTDMNKPS